MTHDIELLRAYAENSSQEAFAELVRRNINLVYGAALRHVHRTHQAEDITQTVFIALARKAPALTRHPALVSWLYTSVRYAALKAIRSEQRRQIREHDAQLMLSSNDPVPDWDRLRPVLDDALSRLGERDRDVILLRYFRGLPFAEVARLLRVTEGAARTRVNRALDKLNHLLATRGISSTAAATGLALAAQPAIATPAGLTATVTGAALASAIGGAWGTAGTTLFIMGKLKLAFLGLLVVGGITTATIELRANRALHAELQASVTVDPLRRAEANQRLRAAVAPNVNAATPDLAELARLRARLATLRARPAGVVDAELRPPQNVGRITPAAAFETFAWAVMKGDLDLVTSFVTLTNDSPENRAAFMANFSPVVRARYVTADRLCAGAFFGAVFGGIPDPAVALQVVNVDETRRAGEARISQWWRLASGRELGGADVYQLRADSWAGKPVSLTDPVVLQLVRERIDPNTGNFIPPKAPVTKERP